MKRNLECCIPTHDCVKQCTRCLPAWGTIVYHGVQKIKFCKFTYLLNLMVHACLMYRSFGAWPKIAKQQLFSLVPIQSIKVKQFNTLSCISQSLLHFDTLICDQRKISIACMAISGPVQRECTIKCKKDVNWQKFIFCTPQ